MEFDNVCVVVWCWFMNEKEVVSGCVLVVIVDESCGIIIVKNLGVCFGELLK